jgi:hypothetical protein
MQMIGLIDKIKSFVTQVINIPSNFLKIRREIAAFRATQRLVRGWQAFKMHFACSSQNFKVKHIVKLEALWP